MCGPFSGYISRSWNKDGGWTKVNLGNNWTTAPGGYKYGDLALQVWGRSRISDSKTRSWVPRDSDPGMNALARASSNCKLRTRPLVR
jgi:hypothetical protein